MNAKSPAYPTQKILLRDSLTWSSSKFHFSRHHLQPSSRIYSCLKLRPSASHPWSFLRPLVPYFSWCIGLNFSLTLAIIIDPLIWPTPTHHMPKCILDHTHQVDALVCSTHARTNSTKAPSSHLFNHLSYLTWPHIRHIISLSSFMSSLSRLKQRDEPEGTIKRELIHVTKKAK